jgi:4'-phosphopantetheinyl transferase
MADQDISMLNEIDLWIWSPDSSASQLDMDSVLSAEEKARAARFVYERDRQRFRRRRVRLRQILGAYLSCEPGVISFVAGEHGKPFLHPGHSSNLQFNLSHSEDMAVLAVTHGVEVGVDVEWMRAVEERIAERFFSAAEQTALRNLPPESATRGFFECWTSKEAFVKARGTGLSLPLDSFDVSLGPGVASAILRIGTQGHECARNWRLWRFEPAPGFLCAVAARTAGRPFDLKLRT